MIENIQSWLNQNQEITTILTIIGVLFLVILSYFIAYRLLTRGLAYLAERTESKYDDIILGHVRLRLLAITIPLLVVYYYAYLIPDAEQVTQNIIIFLLLWIAIITINSLLDAANDIYELRRGETGVAIRGYLDIIKIFNLLVGVILSISIFTGQSPLGLLAGLGAITAVLLLIFRDTILSFVASVQISANDLVIEGDWLEVPSYNADGEVIDITLHQIKIQNWDMTISTVPTYKLMEVPYINWRGMSESGGRRIKRSINLDLQTIRFCDEQMLDKFRRFNLVNNFITDDLEKNRQIYSSRGVDMSDPINAPRLTNASIFRAYVEAYLRNNPNIHQDMTLLVRQLAPTTTGLPIELYVFTNTTEWAKYEAIQAEIFDHLLAVIPEFELKVFQDWTGVNKA